MKAILAIDQGTTSSRALIVDERAQVRAMAQRELPQHYPRPGWVEHDPETIWRDVVATAREALERADALGLAVGAIGITNQRETFILWDRATGAALHPAIVWQDRRGAERCRTLAQQGAEDAVIARTGLLLDSYFSATKLGWLLDHLPDARARAARGELAFGTIDSFLLWRLTGGAVHATDVTNAARTLLFDIRTRDWCPELCRLFDVPMALLPRVCANDAQFGASDPAVLGRALPITGMAGDQQAALVGQCCLAPGDTKITYGTGAFALMNTGDRMCRSRHRLLTTIGIQAEGRTCYALEGSIFVAGAAIKWLRDGLGVLRDASESAALARSLSDNGGVYLVPGFVGLGAPHWDPDARGLLTGMTLDTGAAHLVRAALEAVAYQSHDLIAAMVADSGLAPPLVHVDGGMSANDWLGQFLADLLGVAIARPASVETTAMGAACLAGVGSGLWPTLRAVPVADEGAAQFGPTMAAEHRVQLIAGWQHALAQARLHPPHENAPKR